MTNLTNVFGSNEYKNAAGPKTAKSKYLNLFDYPRLKNETKMFNGGEGIEKFKFEADGEYFFDFLPFPITEGHPKYPTLRALFPQGEPALDWWMSIWFHKVKDANGMDQKYMCPSKTFGRPCPACEEKNRLFNNGGYEQNKDAIRKFNDTQRDFFLVRNRADGKIYVMEYANFFFGQELKKKLERVNGSDGQVILPNPAANGHTLHFFVDPGTMKDKKGNPTPGRTSDLEFIPRAEPIEEEIIKNLPTLDSYLIEYSYDDIVSFLDGTYFVSGEDEDDGYTETPRDRPAPTQAPTPPPVQQAVPPTPSVQQTPAVQQPTVQQPTVSVGATGAAQQNFQQSAVEQPVSREERRRQRQAQREGTSQASVEPQCPAGGSFGYDNDTMDECDNCAIYDACLAKYNEVSNL